MLAQFEQIVRSELCKILSFLTKMVSIKWQSVDAISVTEKIHAEISIWRLSSFSVPQIAVVQHV